MKNKLTRKDVVDLLVVVSDYQIDLEDNKFTKKFEKLEEKLKSMRDS